APSRLALPDDRLPRAVFEIPGALREQLAILRPQRREEVDSRKQILGLGGMLAAPPLLRLGGPLAEAHRLLRVRLIDPGAAQGVPDRLVHLVERGALLRIALAEEANLVEGPVRLEAGEQHARRRVL